MALAPYEAGFRWTYDSGVVVLTGIIAVVTAAAINLFGIFVDNPTGADVVCRVTDTAGRQILPDVTVPKNASVTLPLPGKPTTGIKALGNGLEFQAWGGTQ